MASVIVLRAEAPVESVTVVLTAAEAEGLHSLLASGTGYDTVERLRLASLLTLLGDHGVSRSSALAGRRFDAVAILSP